MKLRYPNTRKRLEALYGLVWRKEIMFRNVVLLLIAMPVICVFVTALIFLIVSTVILERLGRV